MAKNKPFQKLQQIPQHLPPYTPKPIFHPTDQKCVIMSSNANEYTQSGIFKHNLENNESKLLVTYDAIGEEMEAHAQFIDTKNNKLYICGDGSFITYNLNNNEAKLGDINDNYNGELANVGGFAKAVHIRSPEIDEIHILGTYQHCKLNCNQQTITAICSNDYIYCAKLSYNPISKQLMILGGDESDRIWTCHIDGKSNQTKYEWTLNNKLKMSHCITDERDYDVLLFGDIIFVFYFKAIDKNDYKKKYDDIWCLDLLSTTWYKSKYNVPSEIGGESYAIKSGVSDDIHLLDFQNRAHFKVNSYDLLSKPFLKSRRDHYNPLIMGYMKQQENDNLIPNIPFVLKQLILNYYPIIQ